MTRRATLARPGYSPSSGCLVSSATVPIAIARLAAHDTHMSSSRQSRGPETVAFATPMPLMTALITAPLKRYLRMPPRYRVVPPGWETSVNLTDRAEADRSVNYRGTMPTDAPSPTRVRASDELREVALQQFATVGFAASSLQHIADHAGYSKSSVLYHYASKEALLEAAIGPAIDRLETLLREFVEGGRSQAARAVFIERFVDFLLGNRLAVHTFVNQGQSLRGLPVIERANTAIRGLADSICDEHATIAEQMRFGVALAGATYTLVAGATFLDDDDVARPIADDEVRDALITVLSELLLTADGLPD